MFLVQNRVRRLGVSLGASLAVAALLAVPAFPALELNWNETAKDGKVPVLRFHVTSLTIGSKGWSAHVVVRERLEEDDQGRQSVRRRVLRELDE